MNSGTYCVHLRVNLVHQSHHQLTKQHPTDLDIQLGQALEWPKNVCVWDLDVWEVARPVLANHGHTLDSSSFFV
jgi:hypothetical protein